MSKRPVVVLISVVLLLLVPASLTWYKKSSMIPARELSAGAESSERRLLIATQGSPFKDALVLGIIDHLRSQPVYVQVIDVAQLPAVQASGWTAIVVLHTWEMGKPPAAVAAFVERTTDKSALIVVSTSGRGQESIKAPGLDVVSGASVMSAVPQRLATVLTRVDAMLGPALQPAS